MPTKLKIERKPHWHGSKGVPELDDYIRYVLEALKEIQEKYTHCSEQEKEDLMDIMNIGV